MPLVDSWAAAQRGALSARLISNDANDWFLTSAPACPKRRPRQSNQASNTRARHVDTPPPDDATVVVHNGPEHPLPRCPGSQSPTTEVGQVASSSAWT